MNCNRASSQLRQMIPCWMISAFVATLVLSLLAVSCGSPPQLRGTKLDPPILPAKFQLHDQLGQPRSLADARGRVIVLTFMYTNCPDVCPVHAGLLQQAYELLGDDAQEVVIMVVSVDPKGDTRETARRFSEAHRMTGKWWYLVGSAADLGPVWEHYYVASQDIVAKTDHHHDQPNEATVGAEQNGPVLHSAPVYVLDRQGRAQSIITGFIFDPQDLAHDISSLVRQKA